MERQADGTLQHLPPSARSTSTPSFSQLAAQNLPPVLRYHSTVCYPRLYALAALVRTTPSFRTAQPAHHASTLERMKNHRSCSLWGFLALGQRNKTPPKRLAIFSRKAFPAIKLIAENRKEPLGNTAFHEYPNLKRDKLSCGRKGRRQTFASPDVGNLKNGCSTLRGIRKQAFDAPVLHSHR